MVSVVSVGSMYSWLVRWRIRHLRRFTRSKRSCLQRSPNLRVLLELLDLALMKLHPVLNQLLRVR